MDPFVIIGVVVVILSIVFHEVAHGYVANMLGDPTAKYAGRLTLNPIPHIDPIGSVLVPGLLALTGSPFLVGWAKPVPVNPHNLKWGDWGEALVAFAGPATNVVIAFVFAMLVRFGVGTGGGEAFISLCAMVVIANISLAILNLIPIPPLDGSKIVAAFLPSALYMQYRQLESLTYALGPFGLLVVLIIIFNVLSPFISFLTGSVFLFLTGL
ncbi:MAG: site-2 protease family protein [Patescibacteria group bacterium]